ncbi:MAG: transposase [Furfurilactobacillus sp.]|uniref:Transposase n=1 Tax=Furfurilactobacillus milii TaxID=2888272 RepID=A0ABT6DAN4_9LACO|nr:MULTISPECIES: IS66 family insertion sequence element accessory protein TnpB [Furfurilactobacillus]MCH4011414.1 transposase [Furfurilactobacillus sp.]MCH4037306.1 transposase [Furfurilactobacillus sp.]MCH4116056.1 transposase [Furfurilactobacillus sp.]MCH4133399.1 transposase [Furfurilactobacillus sp.]MCI1339554.1 transposase [Furfurilactobacillus sp.]
MMLIDQSSIKQIYIVCSKTALHRGIDGLTAIVQQQFELDPYNRSLYLFCGTAQGSIQSALLGWRRNFIVI